ncbi:unnamed protein product, partial [Ectocarpus sp. 6 AP-2014]
LSLSTWPIERTVVASIARICSTDTKDRSNSCGEQELLHNGGVIYRRRSPRFPLNNLRLRVHTPDQLVLSPLYCSSSYTPSPPVVFIPGLLCGRQGG